MKKADPNPEVLIAPCGMNCAICSRYLSFVNDLKRSQCVGCRPGNKKCSYLFAKCSGINHARKGNKAAVFCFTCDQYPCKQIDRMDDRYRNNYGMSVKDNLECVRKKGIEKFAREQSERYRCLKCGGMISVHNRKCFACDRTTRLVVKRGMSSNEI
jgi:hypothetical protein